MIINVSLKELKDAVTDRQTWQTVVYWTIVETEQYFLVMFPNIPI